MQIDQDFSQYGEQPIIIDYFDMHPDCSRYCVDAGAFDGVTGSNSRALLQKGWSGLLIEPDPRTFAQLDKIYADRPEVVRLCRAVSRRPGIRRMQLCKGPAGTAPEIAWHYAQVNTFHKSFADSYTFDHKYEYTPTWVRVTTLTRALDHAKAPQDIGFMSIDCEGEDLAVLQGLDFARYRPRLLCIECNDQSREPYLDYLRKYDYEYYASTPANTLFVSSGHF
jgi:FkbM family methyltransferase